MTLAGATPAPAVASVCRGGTGFEGIYLDVLILTGFSALMITGCMLLFKRQL